MNTLAKRAADFIREADPFGDRFSHHDLQVLAGEPTRLADTVPADEGEAQRALNDVFTGDPYPVAAVLKSVRQRSMQAIGAGLSRRDWHATETAYNAARDQIDELIRRLEHTVR